MITYKEKQRRKRKRKRNRNRKRKRKRKEKKLANPKTLGGVPCGNYSHDLASQMPEKTPRHS